MAKINSMMDMGKRSMMNSQTALQTVAHNIANKTTEGFSRQRVEIVTAPSISEGRLQVGSGARAASITRVNNPYLDRQLQQETGILGFHNGQSESLAKVENIFNEQTNKGLNQYMTDFYNAFRELANNPESTTTRSIVVESAEALAKDFQRVDESLHHVQKDIDLQVKQNVHEINTMTAEVAKLNEKIASIEMQGNPANDERDRRDLLIKKLQEKIDVHVADGDNGMVSLSTAGNALLVSGIDALDLTARAQPGTQRTQIYYENGKMVPFDITARIKGGNLGGILDVRDKIVPDMQDKIDSLATTFTNEVNAAHVRGFDRSGKMGGVFFEIQEGEGGAASNMRLSEDIASDVTRVAAAARPGAPGDNGVANVISSLQFKENIDGSTMDDFYNAQVGRIGILASRANRAKETQAHVVEQVNTLRESVSGVSLDEEATKMIEYQKAFEASARLIKTADEMFETVLNLKRM
jgi:flagellar hook-associated protein 1 FlgK